MAILAVLAVVSYFHDVPLPGGVRFDAGMALALVALATAGPLAALVVDVVPVLVAAAARRERLLRVGTLANLSAFGAKALAAAWLLQIATGQLRISLFVALLAAGIVQALVNLIVAPLGYGVLWLGRPAGEVGSVLLGTLPAASVVLAAGALTATLIPWLGMLALLAFAAIAVIPQSALTAVARARPVSRLDPAVATERYAHALSLQLGLSRAERRHVRAVAAVARHSPPSGDTMDYVYATLRDSRAETKHAQLIAEWWNGDGGPLGLRHHAIPIAARVLAVARAWSALTAHAGTRHSHEEALVELQSAAGTQLDPMVVRAARAVVAEERVTASEPAPEPRLHRFGVPARLRRALATA